MASAQHNRNINFKVVVSPYSTKSAEPDHVDQNLLPETDKQFNDAIRTQTNFYNTIVRTINFVTFEKAFILREFRTKTQI